MKKRTKNVLRTLLGILVAIIVLGVAVWMIDERSPQAIIISHSFSQSSLEDYVQQRGDMTDQSTVEIPGDVKFPREMRQYRVGGMQVFHMEPQDASNPSCFTSMAVPTTTTSPRGIGQRWPSGPGQRAVASWHPTIPCSTATPPRMPIR